MIGGEPVRPGAEDVVARIGSLDQLAGIEHVILADGPARGMRGIRVTTAGGLQVDVLPDRSLDLGAVRVRGIPVAWIGPGGIGDPSLEQDRGFAGMFAGGLLATCGLDSFGPASDDEGVVLPQHGRIGRQRASVLRSEVDADRIVLEGRVVQAALFAERLVLHRRLEFPVGGTQIELTDTVTNEGDVDQPHMILYHANLGWPLLDEGVELVRSHGTVEGVTDLAQSEIELWDRIDSPTRGYVERVYLHRMERARREAIASVVNRRVGLRVDVAFDVSTLPYLFEWKMLARRTYVLGLEPANSPVMLGRAAARARGELPMLAPGESRIYRVRFAFSST